MSDSWLEELPYDDCLAMLRASSVGRVAVVDEGSPIILPVNFRLAEAPGRTWIALRTRPGNVIDRAPLQAVFEIDGIDPVHRVGWSVLVRGTLQHVDPDAADFRERFDPVPWILDERESWLVIEPFSITGRRLHAVESAWVFHARAHL